MRIRKYTGKDMQEALAKVRTDLGSEAVILNSRKVKRHGIISWFTKPYFEVLAAIDENYQPLNRIRKENVQVERAMSQPGVNRRSVDRSLSSGGTNTTTAMNSNLASIISQAAEIQSFSNNEKSKVTYEPQNPHIVQYPREDELHQSEQQVKPVLSTADVELDKLKQQVNSMSDILMKIQQNTDPNRNHATELADKKIINQELNKKLENENQFNYSKISNQETNRNSEDKQIPNGSFYRVQQDVAKNELQNASKDEQQYRQLDRQQKEQQNNERQSNQQNLPQDKHLKEKSSEFDYISASMEEKPPASNLLSIHSNSDQQIKSHNNIVSSLPKENTNESKEEPVTFVMSMQRQLQNLDIEESIAERIMGKVKELLPQNPKREDVLRQTERVLAAALGEPQTIKTKNNGKPLIVVVIGPTGVGKTTTLAKIAADFSLNKGKKVGLITADTYRIAAVEQLKTYAEILNLSVTVVYTPEDISDAIRSHADKDIIMVDTAGRSHHHREQFDELKLLLQELNADEVFLVLSGNTGKIAGREVLEHYSFMKDYKLLFTKLDETPVPGLIFNTRLRSGKPMSYITVGQSVPDDLEIADPKSLAAGFINQIVL